jgi:hypothetical protein
MINYIIGWIETYYDIYNQLIPFWLKYYEIRHGIAKRMLQ